MKLFIPIITLIFTITGSTQSYTTIPDKNFEQALIDKGIDQGLLDGKVLTSSIAIITDLDISNKSISNLAGIEDFKELKKLYCSNNSLGINGLDLKSNIKLEFLECNNNSLGSLVLNNNKELIAISCWGNSLKELNLRGLSKLNSLDCSDNLLNKLKVNDNITNLNCSYNNLKELDLYCLNNRIVLQAYNNPIKDSEDESSEENTNIEHTGNNVLTILVNPNIAMVPYNNVMYDVGTIVKQPFNSNSETKIPDVKFEEFLINKGYDNKLDGKVLTANIACITKLEIFNKGISDLKGIEDFRSLEALYCFGNNLKELKLKQNSNLDILYFFGNPSLSKLELNADIRIIDCHLTALNALDLTAYNKLETLWCMQNKMKTLDVSNNPLLEELHCDQNQLTNLDLSNNTELELLYCGYNQITTLDLSNNKLIKEVSVKNNILKSLDLSNNTALTKIHCQNNPKITSLNMQNGNNHNVNTNDFKTSNTPLLKCIKVDDKTYSDKNWTLIDPINKFYTTGVCN